MADLTKNEVRDRAANDLGILRLGQSLKAPDDSRITQAYEEVYAALEELGYAVWGSADSVPERVAPHIIALVAENCLNTYSVSNDRYLRIKTDAAEAKKKIPELLIPEYDNSSEPEDY